MAAGDAPAKRSAVADEVFLPDELVEGARTHPGRQRLPLRRWLEESFGSGTGDPPGGRHARMVAPRRAEPAVTQRLEGSEPGDLGDGPESDEEGDHGATQQGDPANIAGDVRVLLSRRDREWRG